MLNPPMLFLGRADEGLLELVSDYPSLPDIGSTGKGTVAGGRSVFFHRFAICGYSNRIRVLPPVTSSKYKAALQRLEPCVVKVASTVLRVWRCTNVLLLPDFCEPTHS